MQFVIIIAIIAVVVGLIWFQKNKAEKDKIIEYSAQLKKPTNDNSLGYGKRYSARALLTRSEWIAYTTLQTAAEENDLIVCPKVRLINIIEPLNTQDDTLKSILSKNFVDFVICEKSMRVIGAVQIDNIGLSKEEREKNEFIDSILNDVGYIVVHTRNVNNYTMNPFIKQ